MALKSPSRKGGNYLKEFATGNILWGQRQPHSFSQGSLRTQLSGTRMRLGVITKLSQNGANLGGKDAANFMRMKKRFANKVWALKDERDLLALYNKLAFKER